jgi:hypothetical protein
MPSAQIGSSQSNTSHGCNDDDGRFQHPEVESFLSPDAFPKHAPIQYNPVLSTSAIVIPFLSTDQKQTAALLALQLPNLDSTMIGEYGKVGLGIDQTACKDLDMKDF